MQAHVLSNGDRLTLFENGNPATTLERQASVNIVHTSVLSCLTSQGAPGSGSRLAPAAAIGKMALAPAAAIGSHMGSGSRDHAAISSRSDCSGRTTSSTRRLQTVRLLPTRFGNDISMQRSAVAALPKARRWHRAVVSQRMQTRAEP